MVQQQGKNNTEPITTTTTFAEYMKQIWIYGIFCALNVVHIPMYGTCKRKREANATVCFDRYFDIGGLPFTLLVFSLTTFRSALCILHFCVLFLFVIRLTILHVDQNLKHSNFKCPKIVQPDNFKLIN